MSRPLPLQRVRGHTVDQQTVDSCGEGVNELRKLKSCCAVPF